MSTFLDCIKSAVASGRITATKAAEAEAAFTRAYEDGIAEGMAEGPARDTAANRAVEQTMKLKGEQRWRRINELRRAHEIYTRVESSTNVPELLERMGAEMEVAYRRTMGQAHMLMNKNLEAYRPKVAGLIHPVRDMDDIAYAAYGDKTNVTATELATEIFNVFEFLRKSANMYGASIPANPNRRLPQTHDRLKVGRVSQKEWVDDHLNRLDWDLMRYNDRPIPVADRERILGRVYDAIRTDGNSRIVPGQGTADHLASRLSKERFLYYKEAKGYLEMQKKYGSGNIYQQTVGMIDSMSRDIATLEKMGPNPTGMKAYLQRAAKKRAADQDLAKPVRRGKSAGARTAEALNKFDREYDIHNLLVQNGDENVMAQTMATTRTAVLTPVLSGAFLANLQDIVFMKNNALFSNLPLTGHTRAVLKYFVPNAKNRSLAIRSGLIAESATQIALGYQRHFGLMDGAQWSRRFADVTNRVQGLTPLIQATRWAHGMELMGLFYNDRRLSFDNLPYVQNLRDAGLTEADWNLFRSSPTFSQDGANFLRPVDLAGSPNGNSTQNQIVANKFLDFIQWEQRNAVPAPSNRVMAAMGHSIPGNTVVGQVMRTVGSLMSFPITLMMMQWRQVINAPPGERLLRAAQFFITTTVTGALITQLKEIIYGRDFRDMGTADFWLRAVVNGGSLGVYGDVLADTIKMFGDNSLGDTFGGPVIEFFDKTFQLTAGNAAEVLMGKDTNAAREAIQYLRSYGPRVWQVRLLMDRLIYDTLLQHSDPEAYRRLKRMEERRLREEGRGAWWGMGQDPRAPNLSTALGAR